MTLLNRLTADFHQAFNTRRARILGIIMLLCALGWGVVYWAYLPSKSQRTRIKTDFAILSTALAKFKSDCGMFPNQKESLQALTTQPAKFADKWKGPYLQKLPRDPWGNEYVYQIPPIHGKNFDLFSKGADGKAKTRDDYRK